MSKQILTTLGIALLYALGAQLGFLVSLPGQTASLLWPPSGIALAAALLFGRAAVPGIFLGALAVNLWSHHTAPASVMLIAAMTISVVSTLSASVAAEILKRIAPEALAYVRALEIVKGGIALAGVCAITASAGIGIQYFFNLLPEGMALIGWGIWWAGDYCGMVIFTPVVWFSALYFRSPELEFRNNALIATGILNCLVAVLALVVFNSMWRAEEAAISASLNRESSIIAGNLSRILQLAQHDISSIQALVYASESVTEDEFRRYVHVHLANRELGPPAQAVGWAPRITDPIAWDAQMAAHDASEVRLHERDHSGQHAPVAQRNEYFPVQFIFPLEGNETAVGFDLGSEVKRRTALIEARDSGEVALVAPIRLVQSKKNSNAMIVCLPVYRPDAVLNTVESRRANLLGFATGVYYLEALFDGAVPDYSEDIDLHLFDTSQPVGSRLSFSKLSRYRADAEAATAQSSLASLEKKLHGSTKITFANHDWLVLTTPGPKYVESQRSWIPWGVLFFLLVFGVVLTCLLVERLSALHAVILERQKTDQALLDAQAANDSKEYFMAAAAHDIKQPLYALGMIVDSLLMSDMPPRSVLVVRSLRENIQQMARHFDVLMDIGKFRDGNFEVNPTQFQLAKLAMRIDQEIAPLCEEKGLGWSLSMDNVLVHTDEELLLRLFRNLLTNAVNYTDSGVVKCMAKIEGDNVEFLVSDTGIGIDRKQQEVVFDRFVQLKMSGSEATGIGLGLSIVEKINHALELNLQIYSAPGEGTHFRFRLPMILK